MVFEYSEFTVPLSGHVSLVNSKDGISLSPYGPKSCVTIDGVIPGSMTYVYGGRGVAYFEIMKKNVMSGTGAQELIIRQRTLS